MEPQSRVPQPMGPEPRVLNDTPLYESLGLECYEALFHHQHSITLPILPNFGQRIEKTYILA